MPGRRYSAGNQYRYGFNGKENDSEIKGEGNQQDYGMLIYDPRLWRFLSVDPLAKEYSSWSTYSFAMDRPLDGIDLDGTEWVYFLFHLLDKFVRGTVGIKPVDEKQLASQIYYQAATRDLCTVSHIRRHKRYFHIKRSK